MATRTGPELLKRALKTPGSAAALARDLGITPQAISRWKAGANRPGFHIMIQLEKRLGIPIASWDVGP